MKNYTHAILISIFLLFTINTKAQNGIEWSNCFESPLGIGNQRDACKTPDGGYIMVGVAISSDTAFWPFHMGESDFAVIRTDSVGNIIWKRTYGGEKFELASCVIKGIRDNRYYIGGVSNSEGSTNYHAPSTNGDAWLIAIDSNGFVQWERCYGGYDGEDFNSLVQLGDSNQIYGIGATGSPNNGDVTGNYNSTTTGWICKINANTGMLLQQKCYGGTGTDVLYNSSKLNNNSFLVQGRIESIDHDVWVHYGNGPVHNNGWLLNIDTALNIVWQKTIGSSGGGWISDVLKTQDGGFAVFGETINIQGDTSSFNFYVGTTNTGLRKSEAFIIKYDSLGNELWQQHYLAPLDPITIEGRFVQMQDKGFVFSTTVSKWNGFALWPYNHGSVLFRTDSVGNLISTSRYGNGNGGSGISIKNLFTTPDNKLVVISGSMSYCTYLGSWSVFQIGHQLSIKDKAEVESLITVYPNPSAGVFNVELEETKDIHQIIVYNSIGQIIKSITINQFIKNYKLNLTENAKGLYFIGIETDSNTVFKKIVLE